MAFECLEDRTLLSAVPFGAAPDDTAEFMLGDVLVTLVLMESHGATTDDNPNTENWTVNAIEEVQRKVVEGLGWWQETLALAYPDASHALEFQYDWTYAGGEFQNADPEDVVLTTYEPIANRSNDFENWIYHFLGPVGYNATGDFGSDIRAFNHAQRQTHNTEWAFTIFAVNDENDSDGQFRCDTTECGDFQRAFAYPGGQFFITPAGRPPSTYAHETGHIFWARDEYQTFSGSHTDRRGYYNAQNWNYAGNPTAGFVQSDSIMANGAHMSDAWSTHISSQSSLEMIGWRDSDGDGIFDVLDVPLTLTGSGFVDAQTGKYRFVGTSAVETLINENSSGLQNDITINRISRAEYRIDPVNPDDDWVALTEGVTGDYVANLDLEIPLPDANSHVIEIRTVDDESGVTSPVFRGDTTTAKSFLQQGINGFVWNDIDENGEIDPGEPGLSGWTVRLVDAEGEPSSVDAVEPDDFGQHAPLNHPKVTLTTALAGDVAAVIAHPASTGNRVFAHEVFSSLGDWSASWDSAINHLRMDFASPVAAIRLDAVGKGNSYGRLEAYNAAGTLVERYTTGQLGLGDVETMTISRSTPDITYAIARGHMGSKVNLDNLRFGPEIETLTNGSGAYSLTNLSAGTYFVEAVAPGSQDPLSQQQETTLAEGEASGDVNFDGKAASWRNPGNPSDVNNDGIVSPLDALLVIAYINSHPDDSSVPPAPAEPPPYYDVDGNGIVSGLDVLTIISTLNAEVDGSPESEPAYVSRGSGEGESTPAKPLASTPFLATAEHVAPLPQPETLSSTTTPRQEEATNHRDLWRTAADVYFRQFRSAERESSEPARETNELDADLDQILPEIALDIAQLSEGAVIV
ncbi:MAG: hypothetical protein H8E44_18960 [Planctomycetes bacterium]|nr:hypothetical protein [Planctomycetota bacterium]